MAILWYGVGFLLRCVLGCLDASAAVQDAYTAPTGATLRQSSGLTVLSAVQPKIVFEKNREQLWKITHIYWKTYVEMLVLNNRGII